MQKLRKSFINYICSVSAMGGLLFGYDWVVIGGAKPFYEIYFQIADNPWQQGIAMSIALAGCLLGAMTGGTLADRYGRKPLLIISAVIFLISAYGTGAVNAYLWFLAARFIGGIAIGIASGLSPMYIAEVAPPHSRGRLVSVNQLTIVIGILAAQIINMVIADFGAAGGSATDIDSWNCQWGWRWMFWAENIFALPFLILAFFIPESPRWLVTHGYDSRAAGILTRIGGEQYAAEEIAAVGRTASSGKKSGGLRRLFSRPFRHVLALGVFIAVFQQWCGTNVIFNYAQEIFTGAGFDVVEMFFNIVLTGITNMVFTIVAMKLIDRVGRRALMLAGAAGLAVIYAILSVCYLNSATGFLMVILVVAAIACYAMTLGPVTWVLLSELFPNSVRGVAMAVCTFALWTGSFTLTLSFPPINTALGSAATFGLYAAICVVGLLFLRHRLPETKGRSLEEIETSLINDNIL